MERVLRYAQDRGVHLEAPLGSGYDGNVLATNRQSALKVFKHHASFQRERDVYLRLQTLRLERVRRCQVPALIDFDDLFGVLEISIVRPPFVLDFAGARLDRPHQFPPDVWDEWRTEKQEQFGSDWPEVRLIIAAFERFGIYLGDVHPGNVCLRGTSD